MLLKAYDFLIIVQIAHDYYTIFVTFALSERIFNIASNLVLKKQITNTKWKHTLYALFEKLEDIRR
jgi:hypothetical protein